MKILVATGSFKDVFSPLEAADVICSALDRDKNEVTSVPFCDGGEYTYEVLRHCFGYEEQPVEQVINPYDRACACSYLVQGDEAHIVSSSILRLYPEEDVYKNPLNLTDYGYGQLIADALKRGCRKLTLYFGGTSTVSCGMGALQALGARLFDAEGNLMSEPCTGADLNRIAHIESPETDYSGIDVHIVADGNSKVDALPGITGLKVGRHWSEEKEKIVSSSMEGIRNVLKLTGISPQKDFTGAAGGLLFGLEQIFPHIRYTLGGLYFNEVLGVEKKISDCDLVITGEGRYDNTADGKAPAVIAMLAKKHAKKAILVCGQIDKKAVGSYRGGIIHCEDEPQFFRQGIEQVLTCQEYFDSVSLPDSYEACIRLFREQTPQLIRELFRKAGL